MDICVSRRTHHRPPKALFSLSKSFIIIFFFLLLPCAESFSFNFREFRPNTPGITYQGNATPSNGQIQLTLNRQDTSIKASVGRAIYEDPVRLWDATTGSVTDFVTHFSFQINSLNKARSGDGLAFFLAPNGSDVPSQSSGKSLGLFSADTNKNESLNQIVAVEFDTCKNDFDPDDNHVGIDVNSIKSVVTVRWNSSIKNGSRIANAWVSYNATTQNLSVFLTYDENPVFGGKSSLWHVVNLTKILPELINVGFSAGTGSLVETHAILSWNFSSSLETGEVGSGKKGNKIGLVVGLVVGIGVLICGLGLVWFGLWRKRVRRRNEEDGVFDGERQEDDGVLDVSMDNEFEKGNGPKRFSFKELALATNNFTEDGKLGEGGFGGVYKGLLSESKTSVAVKRVSQGSRQGRKEYVSEVKIISRLRHRNLVQLIGWCHERREFLLVYKLMPNGSLDSHLFSGKTLLTWDTRYKIAHGLASALLYLQEEWEQCVVHRDVKSSNVMLDSGFNAKLGDFGLARLVDHGLSSQTTVLAGTMGYLAPECVTTGKASKESDVYSFGVVALEIACGRRPVEHKAEENKVRLVEWIWELYGRGRLFDAADKRLDMEFDEKQMECLMVVGLWCAHPDVNIRPSIRQVINVLDFEAPLPSLPSQMPVPMYCAFMNVCNFSYASSDAATNSERDGIRHSCFSCSGYPLKSLNTSSRTSSSAALLKSQNFPQF